MIMMIKCLHSSQTSVMIISKRFVKNLQLPHLNHHAYLCCHVVLTLVTAIVATEHEVYALPSTARTRIVSGQVKVTVGMRLSVSLCTSAWYVMLVIMQHISVLNVLASVPVQPLHVVDMSAR